MSSMANLSFPIFFVEPPVYSHWSQHRYRHHCAFSNIVEDFIAPLTISRRSSLRRWQQLSNLFIAPFPTAVCGEYSKKRRQTELCAPLAIRFQIANSCMRWSGISKGLSQDGERGIFLKTIALSRPNFDRIHLAR